MPRVAPAPRGRAPRNSINDRPSRWKMLLRRHRRHARPAGWGAFGLLLVLLCVELFRSNAGGGTLISMRDRIGAATGLLGLRVQTVTIEGRANTPEPLLRAAVGVSPGAPILGVSVAAVRQRIETLAWVEHATVERRLPDTIVVNLQERRPFAVWQNQGRFVLVDRDGQTVADQNVAQFSSLPLIVGAGAPDAAATLLDALTERPALQARVVAAVRVGERRWNLRMKSGADVMLPEGQEVAALDRLMMLEQNHSLLDRPLAAVDMRLPDRLVVRPQPAPPATQPQTTQPQMGPPQMAPPSNKPT
jgi:cell division protein FtsQ